MNGITVVIPIFNEAPNLPCLIDAITSQTLKPDEVIFVDTGSSDNTDQVISKYINLNDSLLMRHLKNPGGMPGGNRNVGINESKYEWIAFLDAGIIPTNKWLEELMRCAKQEQSEAVFGKCSFTGTTALSNAICAISYGCTSHPVIPASIFKKYIFKKTGLFAEHLRAGEDTLWLKTFDLIYESRESTLTNVAIYNSFPKSLNELIKKYYLYECSVISARVGLSKAILLIIFFIIVIITLILEIYISILLLLSYLLIRGIIDPIRRSDSILWWSKYPLSVILAPICALIIDLTIIYARIKTAVIKK